MKPKAEVPPPMYDLSQMDSCMEYMKRNPGESGRLFRLLAAQPGLGPEWADRVLAEWEGAGH